MGLIKRKRKNSKGVVVTDANWTIQFVDAAGIKRRLPAFPNKAAAAAMEQQIKRLVAIRQARGTLDAESNRFIENCPLAVREKLGAWGIIESERVAGGKRLVDHVAAWGEHLEARQCSGSHCTQAVARVTRMCSECRMVFWSDIDAGKVEGWLARSRKDGMGNRTSNSYLSSAKAFCEWMKNSGYASENPLSRLGKVNEAIDIRRDRREPTEQELGALIAVALISDKTYWNMSGQDRAILYTLGARTGLRWGEIKSLTRSSFDLESEPPTVTITAGAAKNRRTDTIPLRPEVAASVKAYFKEHPGLPLAKALPMPVGAKGGTIMECDMKVAGIEKVDEIGRILDFHSLRHYFISSLARAGVHPKIAQDLARHSSIELTMRRYTHTRLESRVDALAKLPDIIPTLPEEMQRDAKTGTDDMTTETDILIMDTLRDTNSPNLAGQIRTYMNAKDGELIVDGVADEINNPSHGKGLDDWSGRWESNPRDQLGRLGLYH